MPVINPYDSIYSCWCFYVLLTDATYTAFIVPIGVGFDTSDVAWDWAGYCDFIAGQACHVNTLYNLLLQLHKPDRHTYNSPFRSRQHVHSSNSGTCVQCETVHVQCACWLIVQVVFSLGVGPMPILCHDSSELLSLHTFEKGCRAYLNVCR